MNQTWANYGPRAKSGPSVRLFWPAGTYANLNSHRELSGRPFFPLEIMDGSDFQKNKPQRYKIGIKTRWKPSISEITFACGPWSPKKSSSPCFSISVRPAASTVFPNLALRVKSLHTPGINRRDTNPISPVPNLLEWATWFCKLLSHESSSRTVKII